MGEDVMEKYENHSFRIEKDSEYQKCLKEELDDYINWVEKNYNMHVGEVRTIANHINEAVSFYYKSDFMSAIQSIKTIVDEGNLLSFDVKKGDCTNVLFKARVAESTENIKHDDMLHIPFNRRNIVSSQRFSLSGTPCIYLAKSSYTCWLELNKPEENKFFVSAFKLLKPKKVLDLTCLTWEWLKTGKGIKSDTKEKLCTFPLIIATSFLVDENIGRPFHSEYIVSELLMNAIVKSKYDGVAYFSKKFSDREKYYPINVCFALLAKFDNKKYTSDIEDFEWTNPMSLREYSMINWTSRIKKLVFNCGGSEDEEEIVKNPPFTLIGENVAYSDTLMCDFDNWIIEKIDFSKGKNEEIE